MIGGVHLSVSTHAVQRYRERIAHGATDAQIVAVLSGRTVRIAAGFGARVVRLSGGGRIIIGHTPVGAVVLTVYGPDFQFPQELFPASRGGPPPIAQERTFFPPLVGEPA